MPFWLLDSQTMSNFKYTCKFLQSIDLLLVEMCNMWYRETKLSQIGRFVKFCVLSQALAIFSPSSHFISPFPSHLSALSLSYREVLDYIFIKHDLEVDWDPPTHSFTVVTRNGTRTSPDLDLPSHHFSGCSLEIRPLQRDEEREEREEREEGSYARDERVREAREFPF